MSFQVKKALFLDLDGTVRRSKSDPKGFIKNADDIELMPNIKKNVLRYKEAGYLIFGVTNQGGVAHGFKSIHQVKQETAETNALMGNIFSYIAYAFCDSKGNVEPFNKRSLLRKPNIGMVAICELKAINDGFVIDYDNSLFVGDRDEDKLCAENADIKFEWINDFLNRVHEF